MRPQSPSADGDVKTANTAPNHVRLSSRRSLKGMLRRSIFKKKKEKRRVERKEIRKDEIEMQQINTNLTSPLGAWGR